MLFKKKKCATTRRLRQLAVAPPFTRLVHTLVLVPSWLTVRKRRVNALLSYPSSISWRRVAKPGLLSNVDLDVARRLRQVHTSVILDRMLLQTSRVSVR